MNQNILILLSLITFCFNQTIAQNVKEGIVIGIGTGAVKSLYPKLGQWASLNKARIIEPSIGYVIDNENIIQLSVNYTEISHDQTLAKDIQNYSNQGFCYKVGLNSWSQDLFHVGVHFTYSHYQERGTFVFKGNYFGDYEAELISYNWSSGLEVQTGLRIPFSIGNFLLYTRLNFYKGNNDRKFTTQYIPGTGYSIGNNFTMGIEAKLNFIIPTN